MNKLLVIAISTLLPIASFAAIDLPVFSEAGDGFYLNPDSSPVDNSYTLDLGFLDVTLSTFQSFTDPQKADYIANIDTHFTSFAQFNFLANGTMDGGAGSTYSGGIPAGASAGDRIYSLVMGTFNSASVSGLFTSVNGFAWTLPSDPGARSLFLTAGTPTALIGSISGDNAILANAVPEPSTYALLAGIMTLGLVAYRRRKV